MPVIMTDRVTKYQSVCLNNNAMQCNEVNKQQHVNFSEKLCNVYIDTNHNNNFTNTDISDVSLYPDLSYVNRNQISNVENQIVDMARPFDTVRPVYHCHTENSIPVVSTCCPFYTVGFTNQCFLSTVDNTVTHLEYIWDTNSKQGFYYWNQNQLNRQIKIFSCSDTQVGYLQIVHCITIPILFNLEFKHMNQNWYMKILSKTYIPLRTITAHILSICSQS